MARRSTRTKKSAPQRKKRAAAALSWRPAFDRDTIVRSLAAVAWMIAIIAVGAAWMLGGGRLEAYASERLASPSPQVVISEFPAWLESDADPAATDGALQPVTAIKEGIVGEIRQAVMANLSDDPLNRDDLERARLALEATGWFIKVDLVQRIGPEVVEVRGTFVEPFTMIRSGGRNHLVSKAGRLLPLSFPDHARLRLPLIVGARFERPERSGLIWEGTDVAAGLQLAALLAGREWTHQVVAIDVSEFSRTRSLWLTTDRGSRILWGRAPGEERGREVPATQKLDYLDWFYAQRGRVDGGLTELDLGLDVVVRAR